jgi:hypothetical protein
MAWTSNCAFACASAASGSVEQVTVVSSDNGAFVMHDRVTESLRSPPGCFEANNRQRSANENITCVRAEGRVRVIRLPVSCAVHDSAVVFMVAVKIRQHCAEALQLPGGGRENARARERALLGQ